MDRVCSRERIRELPRPARVDFSFLSSQVEHARPVVVLDDDPTGTQTVHGVHVVTDWSCSTLRDVMAGSPRLFYILTNSRSYSLDRAIEINTEIAHNLAQVSEELGVDFDVISRADSTLRGHYPGETDALRMTLEAETGWRFDGDILIPAFFEGGRFTLDDMHLVEDGDGIIPVGSSEFAQDAAFGFESSDLPKWVEEKTNGRKKAQDIVSVSIEDIRVGGIPSILSKILPMGSEDVCVVNAVNYADLEAFTAALLDERCLHKRFIYRTAASFVRVRAGIEPRPPLSPEELVQGGDRDHGGLIVIGSYVQKTTEQFLALFSLPGMAKSELNVNRVLSCGTRADEIERVAAEASEAMGNGLDAVVYTSRDLVVSDRPDRNLEISRSVSDALVGVVERLTGRPRFMIAKGGITSSDIATEGLGVRRAEVVGQVIPGVPVWRLGEESRLPGLHYVVFPGNVGGPSAIADVVRVFRAEGAAGR